MKTITKLFILIFLLLGITSCFGPRPLAIKPSNNTGYNVSFLFEYDGCKVYRFYDNGNDVYFTTRGDVTSIKNDSTKKRKMTFNMNEFPTQKTE